MNKTLIRNGLYLSENHQDWVKGDILLSDGKIVELYPGTESNHDLKDCEAIDAEGMLVIPGLVNAHSHSYTGLLKGSIDKVPLDIYMLHAIAGGAFRSPREIYVSTMLHAIEMVKTGTTSTIDHFSQRPVQSLEGIDAAVSAYSDLGMRAKLALMYSDLKYTDTVPFERDELSLLDTGGSAPKSQSPDEFISLTSQAYSRHQSNSLVGIMLGTDGPQRCSTQLLELTAELENKTKMGWHTHILESKTQAMMSRRLYGKTLIEHMDDLGIINERSTLVHFIWVTEKERKIVKDRMANVVHCPSSALHLGSGIAPVDIMIKEGLKVAIGTDGGNCGNLSMFERIRLAATLQNVSQPDYDNWISSVDILKIAYKNGSRAMMLENEIGVIKPGAAADLVLLDYQNIFWQPANNLCNQLVYNESGSNVRTVFIGGRKVMDNGKMLFVNEKDIISEAKEIVERFQADKPRMMEKIAKQLPVYRKMYMREVYKDNGMNRFARPLI